MSKSLLQLPDIQPGRRNLIAVLDWGLGHASRSLALAHFLEEQGEIVFLASAGAGLSFLSKAYPAASHIFPLPAYQIRYQSRHMIWNIARQFPHILHTILAEQKVVEQLVRTHHIDRIISDSRFGAYCQHCPSVFLTHQLHPIFGLPFAQWGYRRLLRHFQAFWVPDESGPQRLSGQLSDARGYKNVHYIGQLSRLQLYRNQEIPPAAPNYRLLCLLSGPEPQRTYLQTALLRQLPSLPGQHLLIQGLPHENTDVQQGNCRLLAFTDASATAQYLRSADVIICRSGYSTLMDLQTFGKKAVLIPTPGQTEQLYLAKRAVAQGKAVALSQAALNQAGSLQKAILSLASK